MDIITQISELIARKRALKTQIDSIDVQIEQAVAGIPTPTDNSDLIEKMTDAVRELQDKIENQRSEIDAIRRSLKEVSEELDGGEEDCGALIQMIEKLDEPKRAPAWSCDPAD